MLLQTIHPATPPKQCDSGEKRLAIPSTCAPCLANVQQSTKK
jgi:hypothetical protein